MGESTASRSRGDRCPGVLRPWPADDGLLLRIRLPGGRITADRLLGLVGIAERYGDGRVRLTSRANLQVRAMPRLPGTDRLPEEVVAAIEASGLLPSRAHDLVRNVMVSPATGLAGGRADLRPVIDALDAGLCADPELAGLPGRFLFVLDDGRGDLLDRRCDLGAVALDDQQAQLRIGDGLGAVVPIGTLADRLLDLARRFQHRRGTGANAVWHVVELEQPLAEPVAADPRMPPAVPPPAFGATPGGHLEPVPDSGLDRDRVHRLTERSPELVVTGWGGILIPSTEAP